MVLILGIVFFIVVFAVDFPKTKDFISKKQDIASLEADRDLLASSQKDIQSIVARYQDVNVQQQIAAISNILPREIKEDEVFSVIDDIAKRSGIVLDNFKFEKEELQESSHSSIPYNRVVFSLRFRGRYQQLLNFLENMEKEVRIMDVLDISISSLQVAGAGDMLGVALQVSIYYQK